ncbi:MAG TPA: aminotransferase class IV [Candidatus Polarisedimenticolaceae bacterium]|nr:aminotransferase class IV [Candidatus Polarisedimenticolaceae bacterium]
MIDRTPSGRAVLDGAIVEPGSLALAWTDPAAQWGLGVFETIAVRDGRPVHVELHHARLVAAAAKLSIPLPDEKEIGRALAAVAHGHGWAKVLVSRSGHWAAFAGTSEPENEGRACSAVILPWRRHRHDPLAGTKSLAYAASILGLEEARRRGADEGLFLNDRGHVVEACTANVFIVRGRAALTPALSDGARDGVTRARAIESLRTLGLSVRQGKLRVLALQHADEVFLTSSLLGVRPVVRIDASDVRGGKPGPITKQIAERLGAREVGHHA